MSSTQVEWIGWASSFLLVATIGKQIHKQWVERTSVGVSRWLFLGQVAAEIGFIGYSWLLKSWVFLFTNVVLMIANIFGFLLVLHHRRRETPEMKRDGAVTPACGQDSDVLRLSGGNLITQEKPL